jgi:membrane dipeptidase
MFADGCTERRDGGLSYYGTELIAKMNELGMIVDCAHVGIKSSIEAVEASSKPIVYSHTGCRSIFDHPRNKTDEALKVLSEKGGVAGIYNVPSFISPKPEKANLEIFLDHVEHAIKVMGIDHVGIGSDQGIKDSSRFPSKENFFFDRATKYEQARQEEYNHFKDEVNMIPPRYLPELAHHDYMFKITESLLIRGYTETEVKLVIGGNFMRIMKEVL